MDGSALPAEALDRAVGPDRGYRGGFAATSAEATPEREGARVVTVEEVSR